MKKTMKSYEKIAGLLKEYQDIDVEEEEYDDKMSGGEDDRDEGSFWHEFVYGNRVGVS